jgi:NADH:ubiquinone oxidoreductase subunit E
MRQIAVCVGSSCFLKGSHRVLDTFLSLVRQYELGEEVQVVGAFCMERCQCGVSVTIGEVAYSVPDVAAARALFGRLFLGEAADPHE